MQPFRIKKDDLIIQVQQNRDAHRGVFEQAIDGYNKAAAAFFAEQLERAKNGLPFMSMFTEPVPFDHTADYDVVLDGWRMTEDAEIELNVSEFRQYVRDEWGWKHEFMATSANYLSEAD